MVMQYMKNNTCQYSEVTLSTTCFIIQSVQNNPRNQVECSEEKPQTNGDKRRHSWNLGRIVPYRQSTLLSKLKALYCFAA